LLLCGARHGVPPRLVGEWRFEKRKVA